MASTITPEITHNRYHTSTIPDPARAEQRTIYIPCSPQQYEQVVDDPEQFRTLLDQQIEATPELFPPEIRRSYHMKDLYTSHKTSYTLQQIELRNLRCYLGQL